MADLISIIELFKGTIFYLLIGLSTIFTIFGFSVFAKSRTEIKRKSQFFKDEILAEFLKREGEKVEREREENWNKFFDEVEAFRKSETRAEAIKKIRGRVEEFSEEFQLLKNKNKILDEFEIRMKRIYLTWRTFFKRTFLFFFVFVVFSGASLFVMSMPLASYIDYWAEYLALTVMLIGLVVFLIWACYFFGSFRYHFYGEIDDFLLSSKNEVEKKLEEDFTRFVKRWKKTQEIFRGILPRLLQQYPMLGSIYEVMVVLKKTFRALRE